MVFLGLPRFLGRTWTGASVSYASVASLRSRDASRSSLDALEGRPRLRLGSGACGGGDWVNRAHV